MPLEASRTFKVGLGGSLVTLLKMFVVKREWGKLGRGHFNYTL